MLVSLNWLKEFVDTELSAEELAELLTMGGIEVEGITRVGQGLDHVYTCRIEAIRQHPSAEKLALARISLGDRSIDLVCGAPNIRVGQIVPYAAVGAKLPSGMEITERVIKGIASAGMLCSEKELDLGDDASGVLVLDGDTPVGLLLTDALPYVEDTILETSVTPNRGDCLSVLGTAREVAALLGLKWKLPALDTAEGSVPVSARCKVSVPDADLCPRYVVTMVEGVKIGPSPFKERLRLHRSGMRPISNVVDATNLVLLECGQPLHAFDYSLLEEHSIVVRRCDAGETFVTLDGAERRLPENALMIRDAERSVALAGIMGGLNSEINDNTSTVLIESACFERFGIRRTAKSLGMGTEASFRFERGVDPDGTLWAGHRVAQVIRDLAGGTVLAGHVDVYPQPIPRPPVKVRPSKLSTLLGLNLTAARMGQYLERLGMSVTLGDDPEAGFVVTPPAWRWDIEREVDVAEEVARVHGFQNIPLTTPRYASAADTTGERRARLVKASDLMNSSGYTEVITMSFVSEGQAKEFTGPGDDATLALVNPLAEDNSVMRRSLLPGLIASVRRNMSFRNVDLKLYEKGMTFTPVSGQELPREDLRLAGIAIGARNPESWNHDKEAQLDFFDIKGALEALLEGMDADDVEFSAGSRPFLHPGQSAQVLLDGISLGFVGALSPAKAREHELPSNVYVFEILLEPLLVRSRKQRAFGPIPRYPYIERDLSFIIEEKCSWEKIKQLISRLRHDIIRSVVLFDIYKGKAIPEGCQSVAFRIRYQSEDRTLTDEEVQAVHADVAKALVSELGATMRE